MKKLLVSTAAFCAVLTIARGQHPGAWRVLPATGYWQELLHLGGDFDKDMLSDSGGIGGDQLADYGGQSNQHPHPGLACDLTGRTHGGGSATTLAWTPMRNPREFVDGLWTPSPNMDGYIKFWHAYVFVPGNDPREVRFHYRFDDDLHVWLNAGSSPVVAATGYDGGAEKHNPGTTLLAAGLNSVTIKLREGDGGDHMGLRVSDADGADIADLLYCLDPRLLVWPEVSAGGLTPNAASLTAFVHNESGADCVVFAGLANSDLGPDPAAWTVVCATNNIVDGAVTLPLSGLTDGWDYVARVFATNAVAAGASEPVAFQTQSTAPVVRTYAAEEVAATTAKTVGELLFEGAGGSAAVTLHWWQAGSLATNTAAVVPDINGRLEHTLSNLTVNTSYFYIHSADDGLGEAWAPTPASFTTRGGAVWGSHVEAAGFGDWARVTAVLADAGMTPATVTLHWGASAGALAAKETWTGVTDAPLGFSHTAGSLAAGSTWHYAFSASNTLPGVPNPVVAWTATNTVTLLPSRLLVWDGANGNTWDKGVTASWHEEGQPNGSAVFGDGDSAEFRNRSATITLGDDIVAANLRFRQNSGYLTFNGARDITVCGGLDHASTSPDVNTFAEPRLRGPGGIVMGGGHLLLGNEANDFTGQTVIRAGRVTISREGNLGAPLPGFETIILDGTNAAERAVLKLADAWPANSGFTRPILSKAGGAGEHWIEGPQWNTAYVDFAGRLTLERGLTLAANNDRWFRVADAAVLNGPGALKCVALNNNVISSLRYTALESPAHFSGDLWLCENLPLLREYRGFNASAPIAEKFGGAFLIDGGSFEAQTYAAGSANPSGGVTIQNPARVTERGGGLGATRDPGTPLVPVTFSGAIDLAGRLNIGVTQSQYGSELSEVRYTGTVTLDQQEPGARGFTVPQAYDRPVDVFLDGDIVDGPGGAANPLLLANRATDSADTALHLRGAGNTYAGGTRVEAARTLRNWIDVESGSSLGTGPVDVLPGGRLGLANTSVLHPGQRLRLGSDATDGWAFLRVFDNTLPTVAPDSRFILCLTDESPAGFSGALDFAALGDGFCYLGAARSVNDSEYNSDTRKRVANAALLPGAGGMHRIGGGGGNLEIATPNVLTGTAGVTIGHPWAGGSGNVFLAAPQDYTGPTEITKGNILTLILNNDAYPGSPLLGSGPVFGGGQINIAYANNNHPHTVPFPSVIYTNSFGLYIPKYWGTLVDVTFAGLHRAPGGVLRLNVSNEDIGGIVQVKTLSGLPAFVPGTSILPAHLVWGGDDRDLRLLTHGVNGFMPVPWNRVVDNITDLMLSGPADCVDLQGGSVTLTGDLTVHTLRREGGNTIDGDYTLTLKSGALFARQNSQDYRMAALDFDGNQAIFHVWGDNGINVYAAITNANGLVRAGANGNDLGLFNPANDFGGGDVFIHGGRLWVADHAIPEGTRMHFTPGSRLYCNQANGELGGRAPELRLAGLYGSCAISHGWDNFDIHATIAGGETDVFDGSFDSNSRLFKDGPGLMVLNGRSPTRGFLTVNGGSLHLNGGWNGGLTVAAGAVFGGHGAVAAQAPANNLGAIAPGTTTRAATLTFGNTLNFDPASTLVIKVGPTPKDTDAILVANAANLNNAALELLPFGKIPPGDRVILRAGSVNGVFDGLPEGSRVRVANKAIATISYLDNAVTLRGLAPVGGTLLMVR